MMWAKFPLLVAWVAGGLAILFYGLSLLNVIFPIPWFENVKTWGYAGSVFGALAAIAIPLWLFLAYKSAKVVPDANTLQSKERLVEIAVKVVLIVFGGVMLFMGIKRPQFIILAIIAFAFAGIPLLKILRGANTKSKTKKRK